MPGILNRTLLYEFHPAQAQRYYQLSQWNRVTTQAGTCLEQNQLYPFKWPGQDSITDVSWRGSDNGYQIDAIEGIESGRVHQDVDGAGNRISVNGGTAIPQEGP